MLDWYVSDSKAETDIPSEIKFSAEDQVDPTTGDVLQTALRASNSAARLPVHVPRRRGSTAPAGIS